MNLKGIVLLLMLLEVSWVEASPTGLDGRLMAGNSPPIGEQSETVTVKGSAVEVLKLKRVDRISLPSGDVAYKVESRDSEKLSARNPLLVFNHGLGQYGLVTGEFAIKFRNRQDASQFPASEYSNFLKVGNFDIYTIQASSPDEFVAYLKKLSLRKDLLWVEPTIEYVSGIKLGSGKL